MSNIEKIRQEIDTRRQHMVEELMGHEENCEYHRIKGMHDAYVDLLTFLDYSLPEEFPPYCTGVKGDPDPAGISDLEEEALSWAGSSAIDAFIAGAEYQKGQMTKHAVENRRRKRQ